MLTNAMLGGFALAAYLTILVLLLNPRYPLGAMPYLAGTLLASYGLHMTAAFYVLIVLRQLLSTEVLSPGWISYRFLVWLSAVATTLGAVLMWANLRGFRNVLTEETVKRMAGAAAALTVCAAVCIVLVVIHRLSGRRSTKGRAAVLAVTMIVSLAVPLTLRGPGIGPSRAARVPPPMAAVEPAPSDARVVVVALEGASLDIIVPAAAQGRLPHFARILQTGAWLHVATIKPTQPSTVWTAAATGKLPVRNGVRAAATYFPFGSDDGLEMLPDFCFAHALVRFGFVTERYHESGDLSALPLWSILSNQGVSVGVVNWSVTQPARPVLGYLVSDRFKAGLEASLELIGSNAIWPREAVTTAVAAAQRRPAPDGRVPAQPLKAPAAARCEADRIFDRITGDLEAQMPARFRAVRYECLNAVGQFYLRYTMPGAFGDVTEEELHRFGGVLTSQYVAADAIVGRELEALRPGDLLIVVSGYGVEPLDPGKRLLERVMGNPDLTATHERAPDGFLMAFGTDVKAGHYPRSSIVDLAPTLLYYLGLPVGRDMDGYARTDLFQRALTEARPMTFIPTYER
jgi:hypothetical protein